MHCEYVYESVHFTTAISPRFIRRAAPQQRPKCSCSMINMCVSVCGHRVSHEKRRHNWGIVRTCDAVLMTSSLFMLTTRCHVIIAHLRLRKPFFKKRTFFSMLRDFFSLTSYRSPVDTVRTCFMREKYFCFLHSTYVPLINREVTSTVENEKLLLQAQHFLPSRSLAVGLSPGTLRSEL